MKILRYGLLLILLVSSFSSVCGNETRNNDMSNARAELLSLIKERKTLFEEYTESLNSKSGVFGNKTKNDLRKSQAALEEIIALDGRIMNVLNRTLDFRNFEKTNMKFDVSTSENRIINLQTLNDTLSSKISLLENQNKMLGKSLRGNKLYLFLSILLLVIVTIILMRKSFR